MYRRNLYIEKIKPFMGKPVIKVITGMRRVGKSFFIRQLIELLVESGAVENNIISIDKESLEFEFIRDYRDLYDYVKKRFAGIKGDKYLFVDEVQEIQQWEKAINSFLKEGEMDIYITGSNAHLLSSELATLISGRYMEFPVYGLSFREFLLFRGDEKKDNAEEFKNYLRYGGLPGIHHFELSEDVAYQYIQSIYDTIFLKDIIMRNNVRNVHLLDSINKYIFDNIGSIFSAKKIADYLKSQRIKVGIDTVQNYVGYFLSTFSAYKVERYDLKGKRVMEIYEKYFAGDIGIRHALLSYRENDIAGMLENIVFLELKRRGYRVYIGKLGDREIDFIAEKEGKRLYLQVTYLLASPETVEREFTPLKMVTDNYPKYVLSMDTLLGSDYEGINRVNIIDFLLSDSY